MEVVEHLHLQGVIAHGDEAVLRHDKIHAHKTVVVLLDALLHGFKSQQRLREHLLRRPAPQDLIDVSNLNPACGRGLWRSAVFQFAAACFHLADMLAIDGDLVAQAEIEQRLAQVCEIHAVRFRRPCDSRAMVAAWPNAGVSISSRYCWFCAAARLATSSTHSPTWRLSMPP